MPIDLGLERMSRLLTSTPLPWRAIHIAGTNGKGSITAYASKMLESYNKSAFRQGSRHSTLKHARYNSPHLIDRWDCITINQEVVPFKLFDFIEKEVHTRNRREDIGATEFELLTATAFEIFTHENVDVGVVEVGMGGRLDATNILGQQMDQVPRIDTPWQNLRPPPLVSGIAKIGLDHQSFLGHTLEEIAKEKSGIMKPGVPVVYDMSNPPEVRSVLNTTAAALGCNVVTFANQKLPLPYTFIRDIIPADEAPGLSGMMVDPKLAEIGAQLHDHQKRNLSVAFRATWAALQQLSRIPTSNCDEMASSETALGELALKMMVEAASEATYPGRLQRLNIKTLIGENRDVLLDGAHNAQSAEVLNMEVRRLRNGRPVVWVVAFSDTKDIHEILTRFLQPGDSLFAVEFGPVDNMPWVRAMQSDIIVEAARGICPGMESLQACGNRLESALKAAHGQCRGPLVIAGSLYLVGEVLRLMRDRRK
ncbi:hypothetical protein M433DRAFT_150425 [Acidomyces richmondensis BFW]|nr:hypothetical protein M433DRAFT_150425 [Acidomyces richmondensis BFW]